MSRGARRRVVSARRSSAAARASVLLALVPLALILFYVVQQGIRRARTGLLHARCRSRSASRAAAWRTPSSGRSC